MYRKLFVAMLTLMTIVLSFASTYIIAMNDYTIAEAAKHGKYTVVYVITPSNVSKIAKSGKGTPTNPYIIELGKVDAKGKDYGVVLINLSNVVLRNTQIVGATIDCLRILHSKNVTVEKVIVTNAKKGTGIYVNDSVNVRIENVRVSGANYWGIGIERSTNVTIVNSHVVYNLGDGIFVSKSTHITIINVVVKSSGKKGIYVMKSTYVYIGHVKVSDSRDGDSIKIERCKNVKIVNVSLAYPKYWNLCLMSSTNVYVENVNTTGAAWDGIYVGGCRNVTINKGFLYRDTYKGVFIEVSTHVTVMNLVIVEPQNDVGIAIGGLSKDTRILNCTIRGAGNSGIRMEKGHKFDIEIVGCRIENNSVAGIDIAVPASNVYIAKNIIAFNKHNGIYIYTGSNNVTIEFNKIVGNRKNGIRIKPGVSNVVIRNNVIEKNGLYGVRVEENCRNILVENNIFVDNGQRPQAYDDSGAKWIGNTWSDYKGAGPYTIAGKAGSSDPEPKPTFTVIRTTTTSATSTISTTTTKTIVTTTTRMSISTPKVSSTTQLLTTKTSIASSTTLSVSSSPSSTSKSPATTTSSPARGGGLGGTVLYLAIGVAVLVIVGALIVRMRK